MSYRFERNEDVELGLQRIAREQIDSALEAIADRATGPHETTHQVRKRCKKLRGLLRLVRTSIGEDRYQQENAWFRDSARLLSGGRDRAALRDTYDLLVDAFDEVIDRTASAPLARTLTRARDRWVESGAAEPLLTQVEARMRTARARVGDWKLADEGFEALAGGLEKTYRRGRKRFDEAYGDPTPERFHEWRKRVKYGWCHMRLVEHVWPDEVSVRRDLFDRLSDTLGDHHDVCVLRVWLSRDGASVVSRATIDVLLGAAKRYGQRLEDEARWSGRLLFAEKASPFVARFGEYWSAWQQG